MEKHKVIDLLEIDSKTSAAFHMLRTTIENRNKDIKIITFMGARKGSGSSFVAYYSAKSIALLGKKCLYINVKTDTKWRKSPYTIEGDYQTLRNYILEAICLDEILIRGSIENLYIIDSGSTTDDLMKISSTDRFRALLKEAKEQFEYIIVDSPTLEESSDSIICASSSDGTVIVIERSCIPYQDVQKVKRALETTHCNILGVVLNK